MAKPRLINKNRKNALYAKVSETASSYYTFKSINGTASEWLDGVICKIAENDSLYKAYLAWQKKSKTSQ